MGNASRRAVVLAGGSFAASSWELGLVAGLASKGVDLREAALFIGTSAGGRVALHLAAGSDLEAAFEQQLKPLPTLPRPPMPDFASLRSECAEARAAGGTREDVLKRFGAIAAKYAPPGSGDLEARRATMAGQLPVQTWPERPVSVIGLDVETGMRRVFDKSCGVSVVDAMLATTAAFGAAPVLIDGHHFIDGGYHSSNNADLAMGFEEVIVLSLRAPPGALALVPLEESVAAMRTAGVRVTVLQPDEASEAAIASGPMGSPVVRAPTAKAAYAQGRRVAEAIHRSP